VDVLDEQIRGEEEVLVPSGWPENGTIIANPEHQPTAAGECRATPDSLHNFDLSRTRHLTHVIPPQDFITDPA
jgi:hypothetical protein